MEDGARVVFPRPGPGPRFRTNAREGCDVMLILRSFFACVSFCFIGYGRIETVGSSSGSTCSVYHTLMTLRGDDACRTKHHTTLE